MSTESNPGSAIVLMHCPDQPGLVASVTDFIHRNNGNIITLQQHVDAQDREFFMRVEWDLANFVIPAEKIGEFFRITLADKYGMTWSLHFPHQRQKMAVFVSKMPHCLHDILAHYDAGEWPVEIPLIISNHQTLEGLVRRYGIAFHHIPITKENKKEQEQREMDLLREYEVDFVVLARYMQILSDDMCLQYPNRVINIHHSFLPAFAGAKPYHKAFERGVKLIGATSHYVTADLDEGPIIAQDTQQVTHRDSVDDLVRKGRTLEKVVLSRAIWLHLHHRNLVFKNRTVVFD